MTDDQKSEDCPKLTVAQQQAVLRNLNQQTAAWLIGETTTWVRDHAHRFDRTADGKYDARSLCKAMAGAHLDSIHAESLPDEHYEQLHQALYLAVSNNEGRLTGFLRVLSEVEELHGLAGFAAVGLMVRDLAQEYLRRFPHHEHTPTADDIRAEGLKLIDQKIIGLPEKQAHTSMRALYVCSKCKKYRWGRKWLEPPLPPGYVQHNETDLCDDCDETRVGPPRSK